MVLIGFTALTWWNSQVAMLGLEVTNGKSWTELKTMTTKEFCPPEEIQRMESELWKLKVKDYDITAYTARFNKLVLLLTSSEPTTLNATVQMAHTLMEQKRLAKAERDAEGQKRK
ncbi:putative reverse transcriptase domain-containing protein [Tanacetum coccineum]